MWLHERKLHGAGDTDLPIQLDLRKEVYSAERQEARRRIVELQRIVGTNAPVRVAVGSVKEALLDAALESDADVLMIGRSHHFGHCWPKKGWRRLLPDLIYSIQIDLVGHQDRFERTANCQLPDDRNDRLIPGLLAAS
jgi:hypothetical protein